MFHMTTSTSAASGVFATSPASTARSPRGPASCAISAISPDGRQCRAEGTCEGLIAQSPTGSNGFGYDSVFFLPDHNATMAQLEAATKNSFSHRGQALAAVIPLLKSTFPELNISP